MVGSLRVMLSRTVLMLHVLLLRCLFRLCLSSCLLLFSIRPLRILLDDISLAYIETWLDRHDTGISVIYCGLIIMGVIALVAMVVHVGVLIPWLLLLLLASLVLLLHIVSVVQMVLALLLCLI